MLNIRDFGAVADGKTVNTKAIQAAVDRAGETGETVLVPGGVFITGTIHLNGASLHLEPGAVLKGSTNIDDYPAQDFIHNEMGVLRALLINRDHDNVTIDGSGTIDLSGTSFYDTSVMNVPSSRVPFTKEQEAECTYPIGTRPSQCIFFHNAKNVTVRGIKVIDAPCWTFSFNACENVKLLGLTIDTSLNVPNDDGIHVATVKVLLLPIAIFRAATTALRFPALRIGQNRARTSSSRTACYVPARRQLSSATVTAISAT